MDRLLDGKTGEIYNIGTENEYSVMEIYHLLAEMTGTVGSAQYEHVQDRCHNDKRYAVDYKKLLALGWTEKIHFIDGLRTTVDWYRNNPDWWTQKTPHEL